MGPLAVEYANGGITSLLVAVWWRLLIVYFVLAYVISYRRLKHIPGPKLAAWSNLWWIKSVTGGKAHLVLYDVCEKYGEFRASFSDRTTNIASGPLVRIAPNKLVTSDVAFARRTNSAKSGYTKADWYRAFRFDAQFENLFSEVDNVKHAEMRKKVAPGYSGRENPDLEKDMDKVIFQFIDLLNRKYLSTKEQTRPFDFAQKIQYFTCDVITRLGLSESFGWLEDEDKFSYVATIEASMPAMNFISAVPLLLKLITIPAVQNAALPSMQDKVGMGAIKGAANEVIAKRFLPGDQKVRKNDICQSFVDRGMTQTQIADETLLQVLAGSDTTAQIMKTLVVCIFSNWKICDKLQKEVDAAKVPLDEVISYNRALQLPYLKACVKEALRYYPVFTGLTPRKVGPDGDMYKGMYLPPGTEVGVSAWATSRNNPNYGPDKGAYFRPERWLDADPEQLEKMEREAELLFMHGQYQCMGERIAQIELHKTVFELVRRFDITLANPMKPLLKEECYGMMIQRGLMVRAEARI